MFNYYVLNNDSYKNIFFCNQRIIKELYEKNILNIKDLDNYELPTSMEQIIPKIEKIANKEKLFTDALSEILLIESFLKVKNNIDSDYLIGNNYIVTNKTLYSTNPLSDFIEKLKENLKDYNKNELLFNKIGYITEKDLNEIIKNEVLLKKEKYKKIKITNLLIENIFLEILISAIDKDSNSFNLLYKESTLKVVFNIKKQIIEKDILTIDNDKYNEIIKYINSMFNEKDLIKKIKDINYKLSLTANTSNEHGKTATILNIKISNLNKKINNINNLNIAYNEKKSLKKLMRSSMGIIIVSSKNDLKEALYSVLKTKMETDKKKKQLIFSIEENIERTLQSVIQIEKNSENWVDGNYENYSIIVIEDIKTEKELKKAIELSTEGKLLILGIKARNTINAFSKILSLSKNKEIFAEALLFIIQIDKIKRVCQYCSTSEEFIKEEYYSEFSSFYNVPTMNTLVKKANHLGCENCLNGYDGLIDVSEFLENDSILVNNIIDKFNVNALRIEKNSNDWENIFESSLKLLKEEKTTVESIVDSLGTPKK